MKLKDITESIITGVLTRRIVYDGEDNNPSLRGGKILVPKAIDNGLIDHSLLQSVKLEREVKDKFYTKMGDVIMKLSTPYDSCTIDREEDEGLIVPSFSVIIRGVKDGYDPIRHRLTEHIVPSMENAEVIQAFFEGVDSEQVRKSLKGMIKNNNLLIAPSMGKRLLINALLTVTGNYGSYIRRRRS